MKKIYALFAVAAVALSCEKIETVPALTEMSFTAGFNSDSDTRAVIDSYGEKTASNGYGINWQPDDAINIFCVNNETVQVCEFTNSSETTSATTTFVGEGDPQANAFYGLYPYQTIYTGYGLSGQVMTLEWYGNNQRAVQSTFDKEKAFLMAYTKDPTQGLSFKHVFAYVKFSTTFDCSEVTLEGNNGETLGCACVSIQNDSEGNPEITATEQSSHSGSGAVTLHHPVDDRDIAAGTYIIAVCPQTLEKGFKISFKIGDNWMTKKSSKETAFTRGRILNLGSISKTEDTKGFEGSGSEDDPYVLNSVADLQLLAEITNSPRRYDYEYKHYKLGQNIDCEGATLNPIGYDSYHEFNGVFDGDGKYIANYNISSGYGVSALFGWVEHATIKNLTSKPLSLNGDYEDAGIFVYSGLVGIITPDSSSSADDNPVYVQNCTVTPYGDQTSITAKAGDCDASFGGIVGEVRGDAYIIGCTNELGLNLLSDQTKFRQGDVYAAGGIVGSINPHYTIVFSTIDRCRNTGGISVASTAEYTCGGGIVGSEIESQPETGFISNCVNRGVISLYKMNGVKTNGRGGGIIGNHDSDGYLDNDPFLYNCLNTGDIITDCWYPCCGGILGFCYDDDTDIWSCVSLGTITVPAEGKSSEPYIGGMCGSKYGWYHNCFWTEELEIVHGKTTADYEEKVNCGRITTINEAFATKMTGYKSQIGAHPRPSSITYCDWSYMEDVLNISF